MELSIISLLVSHPWFWLISLFMDLFPFWILRLTGISWRVLLPSVREGPRIHDHLTKWIFLDDYEVDWIDKPPERNRWTSCDSVVCILYDSRGILWTFKKHWKRKIKHIVSSSRGDFYQAQIAPDCSLELNLRIKEEDRHTLGKYCHPTSDL